MRIYAISGLSSRSLGYSNNRNNHKSTIAQEENKQINFKANLNTYLLLANSRFKNLISQGYRIFNSNVKVVSPNGEEADAIAFVQDGLRLGKRSIDVVLTDADCYALGEVSASLSSIGYVEPKKILITAIRNYTKANKGEKLDFMEPTMETRSADTDGVYHHIGTELYGNLENYVKKYHSDIKLLLANITTNESWNFHRANGFTLDVKGCNIPEIDKCDTHLPYGNDLYKLL